MTDLKEGELLTELRIPGLLPGSGSAFVEFSRREGDYALAGVAAVLALDEDGTIADARLGLCSVGPAPVRPQHAEALLRGQRPGDEAWAAAATSSTPTTAQWLPRRAAPAQPLCWAAPT